MIPQMESIASEAFLSDVPTHLSPRIAWHVANGVTPTSRSCFEQTDTIVAVRHQETDTPLRNIPESGSGMSVLSSDGFGTMHTRDRKHRHIVRQTKNEFSWVASCNRAKVSSVILQ